MRKVEKNQLICLLLTALAGLPACTGGGSAPGSPITGSTPDPAVAAPEALTSLEAPVLAARVAAGTLPPLHERIPANPLVARNDYEGYDGPGVYGGTWRKFHNNTDLGSWKMIAGYAPLIRWNRLTTGLEPGLAESWAFNEDGTELTLKLREGVRWSDGHPYTSASFRAWYDLCLDDRHRYPPPVWCLVDGKPMVVRANQRPPSAIHCSISWHWASLG